MRPTIQSIADSSFVQTSRRATEGANTRGCSRLAPRRMTNRTHTHIVGQSRTGKSTFLLDQILEIQNGFCLIDPHGGLAEAVADRLPCIYFDPTLTPLPYNPLKDIPETKRPLVAANIVMSLKAIWGDSWGPRMEWILYNSIRLLLDNNRTLLDTPRLLTDKPYRAHCLAKASYWQFWRNEFEKWDDRQRNEYIQPVTNKLGQLAADPTVARIIGAPRTLNLRRIMDKGQNLVVNFSVGNIGATPAHLLGALLVSGFQTAALSRADTQEKERQPFTLVIDEFQNFASESFATILSEAGKYQLWLMTAHQYFAQVPESLLKAVLGNVHSHVSFRIAPEDAELLAPIMDLHPSQLTDLPNYRFWTNSEHPPSPRRRDTFPAPFDGGRFQSNVTGTRHRYIRGGL